MPPDTLLYSSKTDSFEIFEGPDSTKVRDLLVYPNPIKGIVTMELPYPFDQPATKLLLIDSRGRIVIVGKFEDIATKRVLDLRNLSSGVYYLILNVLSVLIFEDGDAGQVKITKMEVGVGNGLQLPDQVKFLGIAGNEI